MSYSFIRADLHAEVSRISKTCCLEHTKHLTLELTKVDLSAHSISLLMEAQLFNQTGSPALGFTACLSTVMSFV